MSFLLGIDNSILRMLSEGIKNKYFDIIMPYFSNINNWGQVWLVIAIILLVNRNKDVKRLGVTIIVALAIGYLLGEGILKHVIERARPLGEVYNFKFIITPPKSYSFPSGHTTSSFAAFGVCFFSKARYRYLALVLAGIIAFSRIYLHVHYPSDVLGGIILGLLSAKLAIWLVKYYFSRFRQHLGKS